MSDEEKALRRAVVADPACDTVRLAYADWLDENGKPVPAAYIRLAIRSERDAYEFARAHWRVLDAWHGGVWFQHCRLDYDRGFISGMRDVDPAWWVPRGDWLRERHPITRVRLSAVPDVSRFPSHPDANTLSYAYRLHHDHQSIPDGVAMRERYAEENRFHWHINREGAETRAVLRARWPGVEFYLPGDPDDATLARILKHVAAGNPLTPFPSPPA